MSSLVKVEGRVYRMAGGGRKAYLWRRSCRFFENGKWVRRDVRRVVGSSNLERALAESVKLDAEYEASLRGEQPRRDATVAQFAESYITHIRDERKLLAWKTIRSNIRAFVHDLGNVPLQRLTKATLEGFLERRKLAVRPTTVNSTRRDVRRMLAVAQEQGYIDANPAAGVRTLRARPLPVHLPTGEELGRMLACLETRRPWLHRLFMMLLGTGGRVSEILRSDWQDYDATAGRLILHRRKVDDLLAVPLADPLRGMLWQAWVDAGMPTAGPILTGADGKPLTVSGARTEFQKLARMLGMPWLKLATARKWAATVANESVGLVAASRLLGHNETKTTELYIRGGEESARLRAVEAVSGVLGRVIEGDKASRNAGEPVKVSGANEPGRDGIPGSRNRELA